MLVPHEFIPLVEQSYLMRELTARVMDLALGQAALWWKAGMRVPVSLNLSARDLIDNGLAEGIDRGLARHGLPASALLLEIDERVLTSEPAHAVATAEALARLGVSLSLDDFGTGYSSLVRLKRLPVSEVKIDSSFVGRMLHSADDKVIVRSIVDLVSALGIRAVAEGVESAEVAAELAAMGCAAAQGWYFSRPLNAASATAWLAERESPGRRRCRASARRSPLRYNRSGRPGQAHKMACMPITRDEVAHLARLARLALTDAELDHFAGQLDDILTAVARVQEVAAEGIPPMTHAVPVVNVFRDDIETPCLPQGAALAAAPAAEQGRFRVPRILAED